MEKVNPAYNEIVTATVKAVSVVVGPVAVMLANQIPGLTVSAYKSTIEGDPLKVIDELLETYKKIIGPVALTLAKHAARAILETNPGLKLPGQLR